MGREDKREPFLTNLGRATMRGLRKCKKCGTMNGTRGYSCKNKSCDVIFKEVGVKQRTLSEPCKINTGSSAQIFSVRARDKGPDYRGFVQLPNDVLIRERFLDPDSMMEAGAKCYVESCVKANRYSLPSEIRVACKHIRAAMLCEKESQPMALKNSVLNMLSVPQAYKEEVYLLATDTSGPLVQRVSRNLVVVKCKPDSAHPLGFLHFNFTLAKSKKYGDLKFYCNCRDFRSNLKESTYRKCVHLYACVCAFASDDNLAKEFSVYIDLIQGVSFGGKIDCKDASERGTCLGSDDEKEDDLPTSMEDTSKNLDENSFLILNDSDAGTPCQVEVSVVKNETDLIELPISSTEDLSEEDEKVEIQLRTETGIQLQTPDGGTISLHQLPESAFSFSPLKSKRDGSLVQASSALLTLQKSGTRKKKHPSIWDSSNEPSHSFSSWLSSVTERINQSMHYGFSGKPEPLVFHLPKNFFDYFISRVNKVTGSKRRKIFPETQKFSRKEAVPLGEFMKYSWKIFSLQQVEAIFSNSHMCLEVDRYFTQQKDGSYKPCPSPEIPTEASHVSSSTLLIRPQEYKTSLRIGHPPTSLFLKEPTPFIIEWIPDILPVSEIGELRLKFEFDQFCNKQIQNLNKQIFVAPISLMPKSGPKSTKANTPPVLAPRPSRNKSQFPSHNESLVTVPISSMGDGITLFTF